MTAHNDGSLSVKGSRYFAYFDDNDEVGAIAAFIVCYQRGLISLPSNSTSETNCTASSNSTSHSTYSSSSSGSGGKIGVPISEGGCLAIIAAPIVIAACIFASVATWLHILAMFFTGEWMLDFWIVIVPIVGVIIGKRMQEKEPKKKLLDIAENYLYGFTAPVLIGSIFGALTTLNFLNLFLAFFGLCIFSIPPFVIGVLISYYKEKHK